MIEVADLLTGSMTRCEGARVYLPGYEYIVAYATPRFVTSGFVEGKWDITEAMSGHKITDAPSDTIEDAIAAAVARLNQLGVTREGFEREVARAAAEFRAAGTAD